MISKKAVYTVNKLSILNQKKIENAGELNCIELLFMYPYPGEGILLKSNPLSVVYP